MKHCLIIPFLLLLISCSNDTQKPVTIKEANDLKEIINEQPVHEGQFWTFSAEPVLQIGVTDGEKPYMFHRLYDAIKLEDGRLMASNSGTHQIRFFDAEGNFISSFGRNGKGPGEFGDFSSMRIYRYGKDSIAVNDSGNDRINLFDLYGNLGRTIIVEPIDGAGNPNIRNAFSDGSWLVWSTLGSARLDGQPGDLIDKDYLLHRLHNDGAYDSTLFSFPSRTRYVQEFGGRRQYPNVPLVPEPIYIPDGNNNVIYTNGKEPEIARINQEGLKTAVFKWQMPRTQVSEIWDEYEEDYLSSVPNEDDKKFYKDFLNKDLPLPDQVPAINEMYVDRLGYMWVQRFDLSWAGWETHTGMDILSPDGKWLGTLQVPKGIRIFEIGEDYLLGSRFKNGVETLVLYELNRK